MRNTCIRGGSLILSFSVLCKYSNYCLTHLLVQSLQMQPIATDSRYHYSCWCLTHLLGFAIGVLVLLLVLLFFSKLHVHWHIISFLLLEVLEDQLFSCRLSVIFPNSIVLSLIPTDYGRSQ